MSRTDHLRFHRKHEHLASTFGSSGFGRFAEGVARFLGTPIYLFGQTAIFVIWIFVNASGVVHFDRYPFILLNLAFSLQAAYSAPLILLAQTRQADRDKAHNEADAQHREALASASAERHAFALDQSSQLLQLLEQNTELTLKTKQLTERIEGLTAATFRHVVASHRRSARVAALGRRRRRPAS